MKETPLIFSTEMVKAILENRKTMTRRVIKLEGLTEPDIYETRDGDLIDPIELCPYGRVGDLLWCRETFCKVCYENDNEPDVCYKEDMLRYEGLCSRCKYSPSIFMPKWATRIWLEITDIRVERIQDIKRQDISAEGTPHNPMELSSYRNDGYQRLQDFIYLWDKINKIRGYGWNKNPYVWVISFKRIYK